MHLYAIHDDNPDWAGLIRDASSTGWAVISEEIGDDPTDKHGIDYRHLAAYGVTPIVRLNFSHHGEGTIPLPSRYNAFAERCANYVTASQGCTHWIIGNEPNLRAERYADVPITPGSYAECFNKCRLQIKRRDLTAQVMPAAVAPYNNDTGWCMDYWRDMLSAIIRNDGGADGLALHTYSRGPIPASVRSDDKMGAPYQMWHNGFRAYRDFLTLVPAIMRALPVFITETDQLEPWADANSGWVRAAYAEIDEWNKGAGHQGVHCLALYRWQKHDQWYISGKNGVIDDFRSALTLGYQAPFTPTPEPPQPEPEPPRPPAPEPEPARDIDPRLIARGVQLEPAKVAAGTGFWQAQRLLWLDHAAAQIGPDHHILGETTRDSRIAADVPLLVTWPSGSTTVVSKLLSYNNAYNYDYDMSPSLNEYSIRVHDGNPSDVVSGIGMGKDGNPREHTSTLIDWQWTVSPADSGPTPPLLPPLTPPAQAINLVWPVQGPITQQFGEPPAAFGQPGHGGIDIAVAQGTRVEAICAGEVMFAGDDESYGLYCRVYHPAIHSHSFYAHMTQVDVEVGQIVEQGERLGASGNTGNSTGPHLHFELRAGNRDAYYAAVTFGYTQGRYNPVCAYVVTGSPLQPGLGR